MLNQPIDLSHQPVSKNRCFDYQYPEIDCPFWKPTFLRNSDKAVAVAEKADDGPFLWLFTPKGYEPWVYIMISWAQKGRLRARITRTKEQKGKKEELKWNRAEEEDEDGRRNLLKLQSTDSFPFHLYKKTDLEERYGVVSLVVTLRLCFCRCGIVRLIIDGSCDVWVRIGRSKSAVSCLSVMNGKITKKSVIFCSFAAVLSCRYVWVRFMNYQKPRRWRRIEWTRTKLILLFFGLVLIEKTNIPLWRNYPQFHWIIDRTLCILCIFFENIIWYLGWRDLNLQFLKKVKTCYRVVYVKM